MTKLTQLDNLTVPDRMIYQCALMVVEEATPKSTLSGQTLNECSIQQQPAADGINAMNFIKYSANSKLHTAMIRDGFLDQAGLDKWYPGDLQTTGIGKKLKDKMDTGYYLGV